MYWAMILITQTIARISEPNAIEPIWYLNSQKVLFRTGLGWFLSCLLKYQIEVAQATMK